MIGIDVSPGVYHDIPFRDYLQWNAMNVSTLKWALKSAKHLQAAIDGRIKIPDSPDKKLGRAIHCRLLEPERYRSEFHVAGKCQAVLKSGERRGKTCDLPGQVLTDGEWLCGKHGTATEAEENAILTPDEANRIERLSDSVRQHPVIKLLRQKGGCEVSICWEQDGVLLKARLDKLILNPDFPTVVDLKKVQVGKGDLASVQKAIGEYKYHVQAAAYRSAVLHQFGVDPNFVWVFVEDNEPFDVNVIQADGATLDVGLFEYKRAIDRYRTLRESLLSPEGYSSEIELGGLPAWYFRQFHQSNESNSYES